MASDNRPADECRCKLPSDQCPYCRIADLEAKLAEAQEQAKHYPQVAGENIQLREKLAAAQADSEFHQPIIEAATVVVGYDESDCDDDYIEATVRLRTLLADMKASKRYREAIDAAKGESE